MKEKWLVSFGITHIVSLSFVLTFAVKNALLFNLSSSKYSKYHHFSYENKMSSQTN